ncbi:hypothetical protein I4U23_017337 [Adineta vaga]|nr:hypothetical protein I4U23_017337 [Adineta vaga]
MNKILIVFFYTKITFNIHEELIEALAKSVCKGYLNICKILLLNGVHHGIQDCQGDTPLHDAISNKHDELIHLLLEYNVDTSIRNKHGFNSIHHSALHSCLIALELIFSTLNGHFNIVEFLINKGNASINEQNLNLQTALHLAVNRQDLQIVNLRVCVCKGEKADPGYPNPIKLSDRMAPQKSWHLKKADSRES